MKRHGWFIVLFLFACTGKKEALLKQQEGIAQEIEQVKAAYYQTMDSIDQLKRMDTSMARQDEWMKALVAADQYKTTLLLKLQKQQHMIELKLRNY